MDIESFGVTVIIGTPHSVNQCLTSHHTASISNKDVQQLKFLERKFGHDPANSYHMLFWINRNISDRNSAETDFINLGRGQ